MAYVADLHIHSRFSRACSQQLNIPNLVSWAKLKGINLLGTGDFLHPLWLTELKSQLKEDGSGFLYQGDVGDQGDKGIKFVLTVEIASIYSQGGKGRRIHNLVFLPDFASAEKLQKALLDRHANLASDGRPIVGISSKDILNMAMDASEKALLIPAHCVLPDTMVHTIKGLQEIQDIKVGDLVYTHNNRKRDVTEVIRHEHRGTLYKVQSWYFSPGLEATEEHPFYGFQIKYCPSTGNRCLPTEAHKKVCKHKLYEQYTPQWLLAKDLRAGDILVFPRFTNTTPISTLYLDKELPYNAINELIKTGGSRGHIFNQQIQINEEFCRLIGYYLAEGWVTIKNELGFCFNQNEQDFIDDVQRLMKSVFGISHSRIYQRPGIKSKELIFSSKLLVELFSKLFYTKSPYRAANKTIPDWMLHLPTNLQAHILLGWWRGDRGYTISHSLMNQMKVICLRLGIIPSIGVDKAKNHFKKGNHGYSGRIIKASSDLFYFSHLAFFEDKFNLLIDPIFTEERRRLGRRHGWIDKDYIYIPIRWITTRKYQGEVINLEVNEDNSYVTEFATVHNCWTPWFGIFGSESGYDSLDECFEEMSDYIYAVETGLSSDPAMNWRISELDKRSIVSFSDAHSLPNLGREATVFGGQLSEGYSGLFRDISQQKVAGTIEFYPEEGKYHYTGHRNCGVKYTPEDTKTKGDICPKCGRGLTVGVMERVEKLASRSAGEVGGVRDSQGIIKGKDNRPGYRMLVPLLTILAEVFNTAPTTQKVLTEYKKLTEALGSEIKILTKVNTSDISKISGSKLAEGIERVRKGDLVIDPGYDGVYGVVKIWEEGKEGKEGKKEGQAPQLGLFADENI